MKKEFLFLFLLSLFLASCAKVVPSLKAAVDSLPNETLYGFLGGFWHGLIWPFSFVASLFNPNVSVWAVNNDGNWYTIGFLLGAGGFARFISDEYKNKK